MQLKLKALSEQVIVITGASSGIGLATAEAAARQGAKVVLGARSEQVLREIAARLNTNGSHAVSVPCDVAERRQAAQLAAAAISRFDRIDTGNRRSRDFPAS